MYRSRERNEDMISVYVSCISILQWAVKLGHIGVALHASLMSGYQSNPGQVHLDNVIKMFAYHKKHLRSKVMLDPAPRD